MINENTLGIDKLNAEREKELHNVISILSKDYELLARVNLYTQENEKYRLGGKFTGCFSEANKSQFKNECIAFANRYLDESERAEFIDAIQEENILRVLSTEAGFVTNFRVDVDGVREWYELRIIRESRENLSDVIIGFRNINGEIKQAENRIEVYRQALKNQEHAIITALTDDFESVGYVNLEENTVRRYRNSSKFEKYLPSLRNDFSYTERIGLFTKELVHPDDRADFLSFMDAENLKAIFENEETCYINYRVKANEEVLYYQCKLVRDDNKENCCVLGFRSVDEETKKEMEARRQIEEANQAKTLFLFNMSHDIRTPMNAITGFTTLAKKNLDDREKVEDYLDKIDVASQHLLELINEVLDMSRVEAGKVSTQLKKVRLHDATLPVFEVCKQDAAARGINLELKLEHKMNNLILADELHLNQILMNILSNAIKYTPKGGTVTYTIREKQCDKIGYVSFDFIVEDTGIGMSKEFLSHIFDAFAREQTATVSGIQGTGLGMTIVKKLVDLIGGKIDIQSEINVGTKVTVSLDFKLEDDLETAPVISEEKSISLEGKRTLLVEDNELNREIACEFLEDENIIVEQAENGVFAVEKVKARGVNYYDFILMDIQMPIMDGYQATAAIRALPGGNAIPIIALSANAFEEDKQKSRTAGMNEHIAKPIDIDKLIEAVKRVLN